MLRFSKKAPDWEPSGAKVRTWLYHVVGNQCIDRLRARKPETPIEDAEETAVNEAAEILGVSEYAAESLLARTRRAMRAALEPMREDLIGTAR